MSLINLMKNLTTLPASVQKNMNEIRKLDITCQKMNVEAQMKIRALISSWKTISKESRKKSYDLLRLNFQKMRELSDEKIRLSEQTYELVDKYIIKLDNDTAKLNNTVLKKGLDNTNCAGTSESFETDLRRKRKATTSQKEGKRFKKENKFEADKNFEKFGNRTAPIIDMPVDPNEPTYCICDQVSFGQMVMCDNKNCSIEWFHFQCVGVTAKPRGKWYCENCSEKRRKRNLRNF